MLLVCRFVYGTSVFSEAVYASLTPISDVTASSSKDECNPRAVPLRTKICKRQQDVCYRFILHAFAGEEYSHARP